MTIQDELATRIRTLEALSPASLLWTPALYLGLPGLRGAWSFYSSDNAESVFDISGEGRTLSASNGPTVADDGFLSYGVLDGTDDAWQRTDETGLETPAAFTIGAWIQVLSGPDIGLSGTIIAKFVDPLGGNNRSYVMYVDSAMQVHLAVSADGTLAVGQYLDITHSTVTLSLNTWYFVVGRFAKEVEMAIFIGAVKYSETSGIPTLCFNGTAPFEVGSINAAAALAGYVTLAFLCDVALSDAVIHSLFVRSRILFGV